LGKTILILDRAAPHKTQHMAIEEYRDS